MTEDEYRKTFEENMQQIIYNLVEIRNSPTKDIGKTYRLLDALTKQVPIIRRIVIQLHTKEISTNGKPRN